MLASLTGIFSPVRYSAKYQVRLLSAFCRGRKNEEWKKQQNPTLSVVSRKLVFSIGMVLDKYKTIFYSLKFS